MRFSSMRWARNSPMLTCTDLGCFLRHCSAYGTQRASDSQKGCTSYTSPPGNSSVTSNNCLLLRHAFEGGSNLVQQLFDKLNLIASLATATGRSAATPAIPQSEASVAWSIPIVVARRFTTAKVLRIIMVKSSSISSPESRSTCLSELEAAIASKIKFITDNNRLLRESTEI